MAHFFLYFIICWAFDQYLQVLCQKIRACLQNFLWWFGVWPGVSVVPVFLLLRWNAGIPVYWLWPVDFQAREVFLCPFSEDLFLTRRVVYIQRYDPPWKPFCQRLFLLFPEFPGRCDSWRNVSGWSVALTIHWIDHWSADRLQGCSCLHLLYAVGNPRNSANDFQKDSWRCGRLLSGY